MRQILLLITNLMFISFVVACNSNKQQSISKSPEDFKAFHTKFYSDSVFQLSRILFPLPGADYDVIYGDEKVEDQENDTYVVKANSL